MTSQLYWKQAVTEFVQLDNSIKAATEAMKDTRKRHRELKNEILEYMTQHNISAANLPGKTETLKVKISNVQIRPTKEDIKRKLQQKTGWSDDQVEEVYNYVFQTNETKESTSLTRVLTPLGKAKRAQTRLLTNGENGGEDDDYDDDDYE